MKLRSILWSAALGTAAAAVGHVAMRTEAGREADDAAFDAINREHGPEADRFFSGVTELGSLYASAAAAGILALAGRRRAAASALGAAGLTWLAGQGAKRLTDRPRPFVADPDGTRQMIAPPAATSWPSSHPAVLTTFTRVASVELGLGGVARGALSVLDLSVATSRVYLGVHYPSDVVSGLLLGRAVARCWPSGRR